MSERSLSRRVAASVVDALKAQGHILVVKGGTEALVRELDTLMAEQLARVSPQVSHGVVVGEVTSTFGNEAIDDEIEQLVDRLADALMESDHVEDVFAEDRVMRRDIFRCVRDTLLRVPEPEPDEVEDAGPISVRLDQLGYVAATVAKRADDATLRDALERAAAAAEGQLSSYDLKTRAAVFHVPTGDPDARLEIEEAVEDELVALAEDGVVELPAIERRLTMSRPLLPRERAELGPRLEALAEQSLGRLGFPATWELDDGAGLRLRFTPLSEQDAQQIDDHARTFAAGVAELLAEAIPASRRSAGPSSRRPKADTADDDGARSSRRSPPSEPKRAPESRRSPPSEPKRAAPESSRGERARAPASKRSSAATEAKKKPARKAAGKTGAASARKATTAKRTTKRST